MKKAEIIAARCLRAVGAWGATSRLSIRAVVSTATPRPIATFIEHAGIEHAGAFLASNDEGASGALRGGRLAA
ncbi:MAG TPA: hypothetical protein VFF19_00915, partial [Reyranella sp.]|nr:hypothetical protein [Reyranella sp.]